MIVLPLTDHQATELFDALSLALLHCSDKQEEIYKVLRTKLIAARAAAYDGSPSGDEK